MNYTDVKSKKVTLSVTVICNGLFDVTELNLCFFNLVVYMSEMLSDYNWMQAHIRKVAWLLTYSVASKDASAF